MVKIYAALLWLISGVAFATNYPIGQAPTLIITAGDMSQASITSDAIGIASLDNINIQCIWTGTPSGTFEVDVSLNSTTWNALPPAPTATGAAGSFTLDLNQLGSYYFRLVYTKSGSTGTLNCKAYGKIL